MSGEGEEEEEKSELHAFHCESDLNLACDHLIRLTNVAWTRVCSEDKECASDNLNVSLA